MNKIQLFILAWLLIFSLCTWIPLLILKVTHNTYLYDIVTCGPVQIYDCGMVTGCLFGVKCEYSQGGNTYMFNHKCFDLLSLNCQQQYKNLRYVGIYILDSLKNRLFIAGISVGLVIFTGGLTYCLIHFFLTHRIMAINDYQQVQMN